MKESDIRTSMRWTTRDKAKAFHTSQQMTLKEPIIDGHKTFWVVGRVIRNRVVFDIDTKDHDNLVKVLIYAVRTTNCSYHIIETNSGYHLISKEIVSKDQREKAYIHFLGVGCIHTVSDWMELKKEGRGDKHYSRLELQTIAKEFGNDFRKAGLFKESINVDLLFIVNSLLRGKSVLRISKKTKDDIYKLL
jgi:hypothetical protein